MTNKKYPKKITKEYLRRNPLYVFVYGDNTQRHGTKGGASLRYEPNTYGFITKRYPTMSDSAFFTLQEYEDIYDRELRFLIDAIINNPSKTYLISRLAGGLANRNGIHGYIKSRIADDLKGFSNVVFLNQWVGKYDIKHGVLFDYENSDLIHAEGGKYSITGSHFNLEWGLYKNPPNSLLPYTVLEEAFERHEQIKCEPTLVKSKELGMSHIKDRRIILRRREETGNIV